jgi:glycosyltransferase involved in cell wall biosynthesis
MKVLQLILNQRFYGAERVVYNLSKGLTNAGVQVTIIVGSGLKEKFSELHASRLYTLSGYSGNLPKRIVLYFKWFAQMREVISTEKPDIVHVHGSLAKYFILLIRPACPVVETLHAVNPTEGTAFQRIVDAVCDQLAAVSFDGNILIQPKVIDEYSRLRREKPNKVIYNPVDQDFLEMVTSPTESPIDNKYVLWCGRLTRIKGADLLLRAFALLERREILIVFLSDGPERENLMQLAKSLRIEKSIVFLGFVDEFTKARYFQHASVICVNLTHPGLSQAVLEAMAAGNPVVTGYDAEVSETFGPEIGLLRKESANDLAAILMSKLNSSEYFSDNRKILRERFSLSRFAESHIAFYNYIIARSQ